MMKRLFVCLAILLAVFSAQCSRGPRYRRSIDEVRSLAKYDSPIKITTVDTSFLRWDNKCPKDSHYFNGNCYKWSGENVVANWFTSELRCRAEGSHLVSILSKEETQIVQGITLCSNQYWIGLVNTEYLNGEFLKPSGWSWWDKNEHQYTRLNVSNSAGYHCSYAKVDGNWSNYFCSGWKTSYVCKKRYDSLKSIPLANSTNEPLAPTRLPSLSLCPKDWVRYGHNCYYFSNTSVNYFHAHLYCFDFKAHVVTIKSAQEQAFVQAVNGCENKFWIGLERAIPCLSDKTKNNCWEWSDLSQVNYENWKNKKPTDNTNECAFSQGYWENSQPCNTQMRFVCKRATQ